MGKVHGLSEGERGEVEPPEEFQKVQKMINRLSWEEALQFPLYHLVYKGMFCHDDLYTRFALSDVITAFKILDIENAMIEAIVSSVINGLTKEFGKNV